MQTPPFYADIVQRLRELGPFEDAAAAARALTATLEGLATLLTAEEREALAQSLPPEAAQILREALQVAQGAGTDLFEVVAASEGLSLPRATEHAQIACRALGEMLPESAFARLERSLPDLAGLFSGPEHVAAPARVAAPFVPRHDLAEGRPGSSHPLSTANPERLAHRHSVARSDDPHADSKLSSAW